MANILRIMSLVLAVAMLAACGRAGAPLTPYQSAVEEAKRENRPAPQAPDKDRPFILDGLLQ